MVPDVNTVQALTVLYDLALTIGSEMSVDALLTRTLQRFLYHSGFPAGIVYAQCRGAALPDCREVRLAAAVGNYALLKHKGEWLCLPQALLGTTAALAEAPALLAALPARQPYRFYLRLPIADYGGMLLLSPQPPLSALPLTELFMPILARLATAIRLCQGIEDRTEALRLANRELEAFSYSVSHDLRAPLRAIDGFSNILIEDYAQQLDAEGCRLLNQVRRNANRMAQLIDDILAFSRMARRDMADQPVDMTALAQEVAAELQAATPERDLRFAIAPLAAARGDRGMLRQVLVNLLANAVKFTRPRAVALIEVDSTAVGAETVFAVRDNGVGFDVEAAGKLFGVFERLHSQTEFEGTGIGLAIVKRIVARHGGRVWAEGKVGEGAEFRFSLPRQGGPA